jgi:tRNA threonylcarbamoyl adenosine modification protein YeaZ
MKKILGVNLAVGKGSVALWINDAKIGEIFPGEERNASDSLLSSIHDILEAGNLAINDLSEVLCVTGPGGYTGIRVSIATVLGLQKASGFMSFGYGAFDVLHSADSVESSAIVDAGRREFLISHKQAGVLSSPSIVKAVDLGEHLVSKDTTVLNAAVSDFAALAGLLDGNDLILNDYGDDIMTHLFNFHRFADKSTVFPLEPVYGRSFG